MIAKKKKCSKCLEDKFIWKNVNGEKLCKECAYSTTHNGVKSTIKQKRKPTGELAIFKEIFNERPDYCELCGVSIYEFNVCNYHHVKHKGRFPELRLDKSNIIKICFDCHRKFHS